MRLTARMRPSAARWCARKDSTLSPRAASCRLVPRGHGLGPLRYERVSRRGPLLVRGRPHAVFPYLEQV